MGMVPQASSATVRTRSGFHTCIAAYGITAYGGESSGRRFRIDLPTHRFTRAINTDTLWSKS
ncbi:hypothetical protein A9A89_0522 [Bifidobacterium psychraerophilum DSM 22366]|nr:hypothetical protein A9A89_0522 [Bifidobacterium psychraerophilum DSM 22366]